MKIRFELAVLLIGFSGTVFGAGDLTRQEPIPLTMTLGNVKGEHRFSPDNLTLETGKLYALKLENPSPNAYYFGSQQLADTIFTRKVAVLGSDGKVIAEVYGAIRRVEIKAGGAAEWWFLPLRTGKFDDVMSTATHTKAGMRATFEVK